MKLEPFTAVVSLTSNAKMSLQWSTFQKSWHLLVPEII